MVLGLCVKRKAKRRRHSHALSGLGTESWTNGDNFDSYIQSFANVEAGKEAMLVYRRLVHWAGLSSSMPAMPSPCSSAASTPSGEDALPACSNMEPAWYNAKRMLQKYQGFLD